MRVDTLFFVFNRPKHTIEVLGSLMQQTKKPDSLFVYYDMAVKDEDIRAQNLISDHFESLNLENTYYISQTESKGIKRSITEAIAAHFKDGADAVIVVEDDIKMHPSCLEFMYAALERYKDFNNINTVCAYRYPVLNFIKNKNEILYGMMVKRFNPWGWATWKDKWQFVDFNVLRTAIIPTVSPGQANLLGLPDHLKEYLYMEGLVDGKMDIWSINVVLYQYLTNTYSIYPSKQLVENIGFDNTGVHSTQTQAFNSFVDYDVKYRTLLTVSSYATAYETAVNNFLEKHLKETMFKRKEETK